jgi:hypothetical protein
VSSSPAYHLRPNKAVERLLFIELLRRIDSSLPRPIEKYKYVGMGGPFLEDFNLIHSSFATKHMTSLELDKHTRNRQDLNLPASCITLTLDSTTDFKDNYIPGRTPLLVWFDYSKPDWKSQLAECCELLQKLPAMSIFKITLTGSTAWLGGGGGGDPLDKRAAKLNELFGDYGPFEGVDLSKKNIGKTLFTLCHRVIADAVPDSHSRAVRTLAAYRYDDGTPILTLTMLVGPLQAVEDVIQKSRLDDWPFANVNWAESKEISVPQLSIREKLSIDRLLPKASPRTVVNKLRLRLADNYDDSIDAINRYIEFSRHVPQFLRVAL